MYLGAVVPSIGGAAIAPDAEVMRQVNAAIAFGIVAVAAALAIGYFLWGWLAG